MPVVVDASIFVTVCLVLGLGVFVAFEEGRQLQGRRVALVARNVAALIGAVAVAAVAGGYWLSMAMP
jgi:hypothetical protein